MRFSLQYQVCIQLKQDWYYIAQANSAKISIARDFLLSALYHFNYGETKAKEVVRRESCYPRMLTHKIKYSHILFIN